MLMNIGEKPIISKNNLLTTVAWKINGKTHYALEGSIFIAGAVVQWLRDGLKIIRTSQEVEALASSVSSSEGVYFVPAFAGLGAPHWNQKAQGTLFGLTRGSTDAHIARAAIESIAFQTMDVLKAMEADAGIAVKELRVDGGATINNMLMQFSIRCVKHHNRSSKSCRNHSYGSRLFSRFGRWVLGKPRRNSRHLADRYHIHPKPLESNHRATN